MRTVKDILKTKNADVCFIGPKAAVYDALKMMSDKAIGSVMVIDEAGAIAGIITERDYARKVILKGKSSHDIPVEEIMTPTAEMYTVKPENTVEECMVLITAKKVRHLPVFDREAFVGLVSIGDIVKSIIAEQESLIEHLSNYISGKYV
jgi:CBS domain-containing protein